MQRKTEGTLCFPGSVLPRGAVPPPGGLVQEAPPVWSSVLTPDQPCPGGGDTGSPIFLGLNPKLAPPSRATSTLCFYVFLLY